MSYDAQFGVFGDTVKWQKELDRLATLYDTSQEGGLHAIMEGVRHSSRQLHTAHDQHLIAYKEQSIAEKKTVSRLFYCLSAPNFAYLVVCMRVRPCAPLCYVCMCVCVQTHCHT